MSNTAKEKPCVYVSKPVEPVYVYAIRWTGENLFEVVTFIDGKSPDLNCPTAHDMWERYCDNVMIHGLDFSFMKDYQVAIVGDFIVKNSDGSFDLQYAGKFLGAYQLSEIQPQLVKIHLPPNDATHQRTLIKHKSVLYKASSDRPNGQALFHYYNMSGEGCWGQAGFRNKDLNDLNYFEKIENLK